MLRRALSVSPWESRVRALRSYDLLPRSAARQHLHRVQFLAQNSDYAGGKARALSPSAIKAAPNELDWPAEGEVGDVGVKRATIQTEDLSRMFLTYRFAPQDCRLATNALLVRSIAGSVPR
jgi:hypothetical protein